MWKLVDPYADYIHEAFGVDKEEYWQYMDQRFEELLMARLASQSVVEFADRLVDWLDRAESRDEKILRMVALYKFIQVLRG